MSKDIILSGAFVLSADGTGATGLTVTIDVWRVAIADLAKSEIVTGGSATNIGDGIYSYRVASADLQTYYYFGTLKTADTSVVQKHVFAVNLDFADSPGLVTLIWNALTSGFATAGSIGKRLVDYLTGDVYARLGAPAGASVSADVAGVPAAVWAYGTRTLTSLSALVSSIAAAVWAYATRTLTQAVSNEETTSDSGLVTRYRGATWTLALTGLGSLTNYSKLWFTVKSDPDDADADALLQIAKHVSGSGDGLLVLNGSASGLTAGDGAIVIDVSATGDITLTVKPATTTQLEPQNNLAWDVKVLTTGGVVSVLATGTLNILADITRRIS